jgi:hypothetical protein
VTAEDGTISDDLEFSGKLTIPSNDGTDPDEAISWVDADVRYKLPIEAIEARDWVEVADSFYDGNEFPSVYTAGKTYYMRSDDTNDYPPSNTGSGIVETDARAAAGGAFYTIIQKFSELTNFVGGDSYTRQAASGTTWTTWKKTISSEAGVISDDLEFSGKLKLSGLTEYADDTAAGVGGLVAGDIYTTTGSLKIKL